MSATYDVFLSHAWADGEPPLRIAEALTKAGLAIWFDADEIKDFDSITRVVTEGLAKSKALLAYYSKTYPLRRACQWELTAAFLAAEAEGDPRRRVLMVNPESKADHIRPIELRDEKFSNALAGDGPALRELADSVKQHVAALDGPLGNICPLSTPNWYGLSQGGSTRFVGRLKEMWEVHSLLHAVDVQQTSYATPATGSRGRISGLGGVGKSLLAEEYALRFGSAYPGGVFWLRANPDPQSPLVPEQREALRKEQFRQVAELFDINTEGMTEQRVEGALKDKIGTNGRPCLWVVDDVPNGLDGQVVRRWFAPHPLAHTLITTRSGEYGSLAKGIDLSVLTSEEAYQLLTSRRAPSDKTEEEQAGLLAEDLGYHPLALDVTASALEPYVGIPPFGDFRAELARPDEDALVFAESLAPDALPNGHERSIAKTMLRSVQGLGAEGKDFLRLASIVALAPIPVPLVTGVFQQLDTLSEGDAKMRASLALKQVLVASLAEIALEHQETRVHTLVSRTMRHTDPESNRTRALRSAAAGVLAAWPANVKDERKPERLTYPVEHASAVAFLIANDRSAVDQEVRLLIRLVKRLDREEEKLYTKYDYAREFRQKVVEVSQRVLGEEDFDTVIVMNDLAVLLWAYGDLAEAQALQEKVLRICRLLRGDEDADTLVAMKNLLDTLAQQGDQSRVTELRRTINEIEPRVRWKGPSVLRPNPP
jgi:hypothetical protein